MTDARWNPATGREWRPPRRNRLGIRCARCHLTFIEGGVPAPEMGGPYDGAPLCTPCKDALAPPGPPPDPQLF